MDEQQNGHTISSPGEPNGSGELNQRTNGPVDTQLTSGPGILSIISKFDYP